MMSCVALRFPSALRAFTPFAAACTARPTTAAAAAATATATAAGRPGRLVHAKGAFAAQRSAAAAAATAATAATAASAATQRPWRAAGSHEPATAAAPAAAAAATATAAAANGGVFYCQRRGLHFESFKEFIAFTKGPRGVDSSAICMRWGRHRPKRKSPFFVRRRIFEPSLISTSRVLLLQQQPLTPANERNNSLKAPKGGSYPLPPAAAAAAAAAARAAVARTAAAAGADAQQLLSLHAADYLSRSSRSGVGEKLLLLYTPDAAAPKQQLQQQLQQQMPYADITATCVQGSRFISVCCNEHQKDVLTFPVPADPKKFEPSKAVAAVFARMGFA